MRGELVISSNRIVMSKRSIAKYSVSFFHVLSKYRVDVAYSSESHFLYFGLLPDSQKKECLYYCDISDKSKQRFKKSRCILI